MMPLLDNVLISGEWLFYQDRPDVVQMYRHRDGAWAQAVIDEDGVCVVDSPYVPLPTYVVNQIRLMLNLVEVAE